MSITSQENKAWILATADALNRYGSWTGRIHIHKHLFVTDVLDLAEPPFEFVLYDYGPYSFDLDEDIVELEMFGLLDRSYPKPNYGPRYEPTVQGLAVARTLEPEKREVIEKVAQTLGKRKSQQLELLATSLWVQREECVTGKEQIAARVKIIKPKYNEQEIQQGLNDAIQLSSDLTA